MTGETAAHRARLAGARVAVRFVRRLAKPVLGTAAAQPLFTELHRLALEGLNAGASADHPDSSGERMVLESLPESPLIWDVGANVGTYSRLALEVRPAARIVAFEPDPQAFAALQNVSGIDAYNIALGRDAGTITLFRPEPGSPMASPYQRHHQTVRWDHATTVPVTTIDDLAPARIDLLKIDVEGYELAVLQGGRGTIEAGAVPLIQFEFGGTAADARIYLRDFFEALPRYRIHRILRDGIVPVDYDERWEILTTTNFLAVLYR